jgi:hypothetical protein
MLTGKIVQRVHWLQARAQRNRWREEFTLVRYEMEWTVRYYIHQSEVWKQRGRVAKQGNKEGPAVYAARKSHIWWDVAAAAERKFIAVNSTYVSTMQR